MTEYASEWRAAGACLTADPELFYPIATGAVGARQVRLAQRVCARCRVRRQCLEFAMRTGEVHGIWGGTTPEERIQARRREQAAARRVRRLWHDGAGSPDARAS